MGNGNYLKEIFFKVLMKSTREMIIKWIGKISKS